MQMARCPLCLSQQSFAEQVGPGVSLCEAGKVSELEESTVCMCVCVVLMYVFNYCVCTHMNVYVCLCAKTRN